MENLKLNNIIGELNKMFSKVSVEGDKIIIGETPATNWAREYPFKAYIKIEANMPYFNIVNLFELVDISTSYENTSYFEEKLKIPQQEGNRMYVIPPSFFIEYPNRKFGKLIYWEKDENDRLSLVEMRAYEKYYSKFNYNRIEGFINRLYKSSYDLYKSKDVMKILEETKDTGFNTVIEDIIVDGIPKNKWDLAKKIKYFKREEKEVTTFYELETALDGLKKFDIPLSYEVMRIKEACFLQHHVLSDYIGSETLTAENALEVLKITKDGEINFTPTSLSVIKIKYGYIVYRLYGVQFILKKNGSWFICDPNKSIIKTISNTEIEKLKKNINLLVNTYWNGGEPFEKEIDKFN